MSATFKVGDIVRCVRGSLRGEVGEIVHLGRGDAAGTAFVQFPGDAVRDEHGASLGGAAFPFSWFERVTGPVLCARCAANPTRACGDEACSAAPRPAAVERRDPIEQAREQAHAAGWESKPGPPGDLLLCRPGALTVTMQGELDALAGRFFWDVIIDGEPGGLMLSGGLGGPARTAAEAIAEVERRLERITRAVRGA